MYKALKRFAYDGKMYDPDSKVPVKDKDIRILTAIGRIEQVDAPKPAIEGEAPKKKKKQSDVEKDEDEKPKGKALKAGQSYKTRDMKAE